MPPLPLRLLIVAALLAGSPALAQSRIKDIAQVQDMAEASLVGYGVVVGLAGTGDSALSSRVPAEPGVRVGRNSASVMVTARLAPGMAAGSRVDVTVAALGDARSLNGGHLVPTALEGGDRQALAVAEGPISTGGYAVQAAGQRLSRGNATGGIPGGAVVERDLPSALGQGGEVRFVLRNPDFTTARRMAETINGAMGRNLARARDNALVIVQIPGDLPDGAVGLIATVEGLTLQADRPASRIVVDGRSGAIVSGLDIPLAGAAISHGALTVRVTEAPQVSQPPPFSSGGRTVVVPRSTIEVDEGGRGGIIALAPGSTVGDLLRRLNAAGMSPLDQLAVLQSLRAAGGLNAELITR